MALPKVELPRSSVEVGGQKVEFRSLSRKEAIKLQDYQDDADGAEVHILMCGTGCTEAEANEFRESANLTDADVLIKAILVLSGLAPKTNLA